jgi:hypothetical protein
MDVDFEIVEIPKIVGFRGGRQRGRVSRALDHLPADQALRIFVKGDQTPRQLQAQIRSAAKHMKMDVRTTQESNAVQVWLRSAEGQANAQA